MKIKPVKRILLFLLIIVFIFMFRYCWVSFPIMSGYGAKILCSGIFVSGRNEEDVKQQDLGFSPLNLVNYKVNYSDSSVATSVFGFAKRKAIFRKGLGATLVVELAEQVIRSQNFLVSYPPVINTDSIPWPLGDKTSDSNSSNVDAKALRNAMSASFKETDSARLIRTRAIIIVYDGTIIAERYADGITKDIRLTGWSMTKSLTGALIGILVKGGKLKEEDAAPVAVWKNVADKRHMISIKTLLQQSSGLDFEEDYSKYSDATRMLFMRADMAAYTASRPLKHEPGSVFYYSSGNSNILSGIIRHAIPKDDYYRFPYESLFYKLGMYSAVIEPDASGNFVGSSYSYATARDWARFGLLYLNDGIVNSERLLPEGWVRKTVTPANSAKKGEYGYQFWLNAGQGENHINRKFPDLPADMFYADGFEGQNIFIVPSKKLVVVRLGMTQHGGYDPQSFLLSILKSIK